MGSRICARRLAVSTPRSQAHAGLLSAHAHAHAVGHNSHAQRGTCIAETMTLGKSGGSHGNAHMHAQCAGQNPRSTHHAAAYHAALAHL